MKGAKATENLTEDWKRGPFNIKSNTKFNLRKKVETTSLCKITKKIPKYWQEMSRDRNAAAQP